MLEVSQTGDDSIFANRLASLKPPPILLMTSQVWVVASQVCVVAFTYDVWLVDV